ncbi:hypothetical protein DNK47_02085 [Mycoplasma wenyonii]|uniref:Uncharacterized protein n=1 Tax=Mycoplasma wenyonii TaxID=65123 RepID=A0A328PKQ2_9MOLU|nr:hypothetical protein [Mycoplasma wenyonii]RAO94984.1 hypothetical protein DNK47_02085 [Mycoplasma wenyonii]
MFSSNLALSGLALGVIGCVSSPLIYPYFSTGGGIKDIVTNTEIKQVTQEPSVKKEVPKIVKTFSMALTDNDVDNGVYAKVTLEQEGDKKTWNVSEVTWRGARWQNSWTLHYDDVTREYTFTDRSWTNWNAPCYGTGLGWKSSIACLLHGKVTSQYKNTWEKDFLKVKLDGWRTKWLTRRGYWFNEMPDYLERCNRATITEKPDTNLEVSIHCKDVTLYKTFKNPEETGSTLSK